MATIFPSSCQSVITSCSSKWKVSSLTCQVDHDDLLKFFSDHQCSPDNRKASPAPGRVFTCPKGQECACDPSMNRGPGVVHDPMMALVFPMSKSRENPHSSFVYLHVNCQYENIRNVLERLGLCRSCLPHLEQLCGWRFNGRIPAALLHPRLVVYRIVSPGLFLSAWEQFNPAHYVETRGVFYLSKNKAGESKVKKMLRQSEGGTLSGAPLFYTESFFWQGYEGMNIPDCLLSSQRQTPFHRYTSLKIPLYRG